MGNPVLATDDMMQVWHNSKITAQLLFSLVMALSVLLPGVRHPVCADSPSLLTVVFDNGDDATGTSNANNEIAFVEIEPEAPSPLRWQNTGQYTNGQYTNSGITNAAYVAAVPNTGAGTQYATSAGGIVFPQAYWNGNTERNPIRLASATLTDDLSGTTYGSIPSGTPVVLLAQNDPLYAPVNSLSPSTNPAAAGPTFTGPYSSPQSGYATSSSYDPNFRSALSERYDQMMSFNESLKVKALWMSEGGSDPLGNTELLGLSRFAIPCQMMGDTMFYVAPAFQVNFWSSPPKWPQYPYTMRDTTFGAWLEAGIEPELGNEFRFDLWGSVGVYSDFNKITSDCIYVKGQARGFYQYSTNLELMAGVQYLNRERIKLMPTFGVIWMPSDVFQCFLIFPEPKILRHIYTVSDTQWWAYVRGEYGGGSWAVNTNNDVFRTDYNDIRVALGLEFRNRPKQCLSGYFEVGGAFNRELYSNGDAWYKPSSCVFLAGGLRY